jgi:quinol-cytochrome oxidoreductase complex cytochrome b subunit
MVKFQHKHNRTQTIIGITIPIIGIIVLTTLITARIIGITARTISITAQITLIPVMEFITIRVKEAVIKLKVPMEQ